MSERVTTYKFGPYEVHTRARELYNQGIKLKLRPQAFQVLQVQVEHAGDVVTREELRQTLWPAGTFVDFEHCCGPGQPETLGHSDLRAAWTAFMSGFTSAFPDSQISVESCIAEGDQVVACWMLTGTHQGEFQGIPPTGRTVKFGGIEFNRFVNGKLIEHRCNFDNIALLQQIGAIPA